MPTGALLRHVAGRIAMILVEVGTPADHPDARALRVTPADGEHRSTLPRGVLRLVPQGGGSSVSLHLLESLDVLEPIGRDKQQFSLDEQCGHRNPAYVASTSEAT